MPDPARELSQESMLRGALGLGESLLRREARRQLDLIEGNLHQGKVFGVRNSIWEVCTTLSISNSPAISRQEYPCQRQSRIDLLMGRVARELRRRLCLPCRFAL